MWEYRVEVINTYGADLEAVLNQIGEEGWELVAIYQDAEFIFKRPKQGV